MSFTTALWTADGDRLVPVQRSTLKSEKQLEIWLENDPSVLGRELLIIGRQIHATGGPLDLLAMDEDGDLVILELKRNKTPREVVAQILDYASWVRTLDYRAIDELCQKHNRKSLTEAFQSRFQSVIPETACSTHSMIIVASTLDESSERIIEYLQDEHGININAIFFNVFEIDGKICIARSWLADPERTKEHVEQRTKPPWKGTWFVNNGVNPSNGRSWEGCVKFGFISAGGGRFYSDQLAKLQPGDPIFAYEKGRGYVGYGVVTSSAVAASDFPLKNGEKLTDAMNELARANGHKEFDSKHGDPDRQEYAIGVDWKATVGPNEDGKWRAGLFAKMNVVCRLRDQKTIDFVSSAFGITVDESVA